jgi:hypothetical protein
MLTTDTVANIKACNGIYRASDTARHFGVHRSTVKRIWDGQVHRQVSPAPDFPDIAALRRPVDLIEDINLLLDRGLCPYEVALALGISERSVWVYKGVFI